MWMPVSSFVGPARPSTKRSSRGESYDSQLPTASAFSVIYLSESLQLRSWDSPEPGSQTVAHDFNEKT